MKKLLCALLALMLLGGALAEEIALKVWGSQEDQELLAELCEAFAAEHPENEWTFTYGVVGEADAKTRYLEDPAAAADVFSYPDDQIIDLVNADALYEVTRDLDAIIAANTPGSIQAASVNGVLYGYPMTADNGYFLYYDKSVLTEEDVQTLDGILAAANAAASRCRWTSPTAGIWRASSSATAARWGWTKTAGRYATSTAPRGLAAAEAVRAFCNDPAFTPGDDSFLMGAIGDSVCAGVSGTWCAEAISEKLGENYGACKLPTFTVDGEQVQMGSFLGCKILGVNTQTAHPVEAMMLAEYLTSEEAQVRRFEARGYGPSNIAAAFFRSRGCRPGALGAGGAERLRHQPTGAGRFLDARGGAGRGI